MQEEASVAVGLTGEVVAVFGGIQVLVAGLATWLGGIWRDRIAARERAKHEKKLEEVRGRLGADLEQLKSALGADLERTKSELAAANQETQAHLESALGADLERLKSELAVANQATQAQLDHILQVEQAVFAKEFEILQSLWRKLVPLRAAVLNLIPKDKGKPRQLPDGRFEDVRERKERALEELGEAFRDCFDEIEVSRPFYSPAIYNVLMDFLAEVRRIESKEREPSYKRSSFLSGLPGSPNDFDREAYEDDRNRRKIVEDIDAVCDAIRTRAAETAAWVIEEQP